MSKPRPFASIGQHDETLAAGWNATVRPDDSCGTWVESAYRFTSDYVISILDCLNGRKRLVRGNHNNHVRAMPMTLRCRRPTASGARDGSRTSCVTPSPARGRSDPPPAGWTNGKHPPGTTWYEPDMPAKHLRHIALAGPLAEWVDGQGAKGEYTSVSGLIRTVVRVSRTQDEAHAAAGPAASVPSSRSHGRD